VPATSSPPRLPPHPQARRIVLTDLSRKVHRERFLCRRTPSRPPDAALRGQDESEGPGREQKRDGHDRHRIWTSHDPNSCTGSMIRPQNAPELIGPTGVHSAGRGRPSSSMPFRYRNIRVRSFGPRAAARRFRATRSSPVAFGLPAAQPAPVADGIAPIHPALRTWSVSAQR